MSLILEALRKSEAERRRGQAPDLLSETAPMTPAARTGLPPGLRWVLVATVALIAAVLILLGWLRGGVTSAVDHSAIPGSADAEAHAPSSPPNAAHVASTPARVAATPVRTVALVPAPAIAPAAVAPAPFEAPATTSHGGENATPPDIATAAPAPPIALPEPEPAAAEPTAAPAVSFTSPDLPLRLGDLSSEERRQLPAMKMSMHMWAPDAAHRFAIIDGNRVNEGDRVGEATVEAIQQDGVMLTWRGRRIRLPIR